ncbi:helix-turn-helix domain-containing protein [Pelagibacterium lentulum]|uniref:Transcriptional regulator n=1 Tax=Pelagibacterium lentulum TaxID=2029865 RepID=A0A916VUK7_9HYPH|nr:helix-turn-helix transcriptional regulator [Pelagibacterium lentulum]GGA37467.1 transcriptional regulator [Pelagibacterium lentulum]
MTPLGAKLRKMRADRNIALKDMARALNVSSAYLSALEHGKRGKPTWYMVQRIIAFFNVIWDEAEEIQRLAEISDPKISIDTAGLPPEATELTNVLAREIKRLSPNEMREIRDEIMRRAVRQKS